MAKRRISLTTWLIGLTAVAGAAAGLAAVYVSGGFPGNGGTVSAECAAAAETARAVEPFATGEVAAFRVAAAPERLADLAFKDPDGLMLEIVAHPGAEGRPAWSGAPGISIEHALHGFHSVTLWESHRDDTERLLLDILGFRPRQEEGTTLRWGDARA